MLMTETETQDRKEKVNESVKRYRLKNKGVKEICKICGRAFQKGRLYEHKKVQFHQIAVLQKQLDELKNKNI